ncbi:uncharacterized protein SPPG_05348 [Spizellomyces punctatus DAOM BR117]|uniref:RWD domain-containing protein n=1 Tax=Spizellomyces punctatus (strain DAOM BR117) TaxID=645134 RepID=A0A0L0HGK8_SPIPD|nr:uncharacterized protein SPPG_05348 [Spizellomyces punctatus DAOM BR117]KNC99973.1 hypothetical protein SPPG_05348 [Spizellomyces punctatus DAOM BR117]|eukprot:XP_016608013.1 hypothetical protein SPPG_05348 [Spizellomyces punctatus DAOM BR117]
MTQEVELGLSIGNRSDLGNGAGKMDPRPASAAGHNRTSSVTSSEAASQQAQSAPSSTTFYQSLAVHLAPPVTSLSISPNGRDVVLAAKRGLYIVDLDNPYDPPRVIHHMTNWEVSDVQWNPHKSREHWIATTSNQKALVWNLTPSGSDSSSKHIQYILGTHQRAVSDLNWSPFHPELLATCSYDTYVHLWDLRKNPDKPANSFCAWTAGATQVKFNRLNDSLLASSHDTDVKIWDVRKGSTPVTLITAHMTKIYGIDWSRNNEDEIITCSQDRLVKFWDITQPRTCQATIVTGSPVWRARFTPFGNGIVTMPQRKDTNLLLWSCDNLVAPVYSFEGHTDVPREFVWRVRGGENSGIDDRAFQLVTWSKDQHLRLWPIDAELTKAVGHNPGPLLSPNMEREDSTDSAVETTPLPRSMSALDLPSARYAPLRKKFSEAENDVVSEGHTHSHRRQSRSLTIRSSSSADRSEDPTEDWLESRGFDHNIQSPLEETEAVPRTLEEEITLVTKKYSMVHFEKVNLSNRTCTITLQRANDNFASYQPPLAAIPSAFLRIDMSFPPQYPNHVAPIMEIQKTGMVSMANRTYLAKKLAQIANVYVQNSTPCLEPCVRYLLLGTAGDTAPMPPSLPNSEDGKGVNLSRASSELLTTSALGDEKDIGLLSETVASTGLLHDNDDIDSDTTSSSDAGGVSLVPGRLKNTMREKRLLKEVIVGKDNNNVPFPRLCGASFSPNGKLVYFFSPLPHPSATKFTAYTLVTRNQQPVLQSQHFTTQPKTYPLYENYRAFVLARFPKMFIAGGNIYEPGALDGLETGKMGTSGKGVSPGKLNYWLDSDESGEESPAPSLFWRPKPGASLQPALFSSADFLARLHQHPPSSISSNTASPLLPASVTPNPSAAVLTRLSQTPFDPQRAEVGAKEQSALSATYAGRTTPINSPKGHRSLPTVSHRTESFSLPSNKNEVHPGRPASISIVPTVGENGVASAPIPSDVLKHPISSQPMTASAGSRPQSLLFESPPGSPPHSPRHSFSGSLRHSPSPLRAIKHRRANSAEVSGSGSEYGSVASSLDERGAQIFSGQAIGDSPMTGSTIDASVFRRPDLVDRTNDTPIPASSPLLLQEPLPEPSSYGTIVHIKDVSDLLPTSETLAKAYTLHGDDPVAICAANCSAAQHANRPDLMRIWSLAGLLLAECASVKPDALLPEEHPRRSRRRRLRDLGKRKDQTHIARDGHIVVRSSMYSSGDKRRRAGAGLEQRDDREQWAQVEWQWHPFGRRMVHDL